MLNLTLGTNTSTRSNHIVDNDGEGIARNTGGAFCASIAQTDEIELALGREIVPKTIYFYTCCRKAHKVLELNDACNNVNIMACGWFGNASTDSR